MDFKNDKQNFLRMSEETVKEDPKKCYEIKRRYIIISLGVVLLSSGHSSCTNLQTSINVTGGLGSLVSSVNYGSQIIVSLFLAPFLLRLFGAKKCLILSEVCYLLFVVANFTQTKAVLLIGAISAGMGQGLFWIPIGISFLHFGRLYHRYSSKSIDACVLEMTCIVFSFYQLNQVLGNTFVFAILTAFRSSKAPAFPENASYTTSSIVNQTSVTSTVINVTSPSTHPTEFVDRFAFCGANDCQDSNVTQENIEQFVPSNPVALYALMGCFVALMVMGIIVHIIFVPEISLALLNSHKNLPDGQKHVEVPDADKMLTRNERRNIKNMFTMSVQAIKDTTALFFHPKQMLITPLNFYFGLSVANVCTENTRSFASCILGVSQVGVCMILFSSMNTVYSFGIGRLSESCNRSFLIVLGFTVELVIYMFSLLWHPSEEYSWMVYLMYCLSGISAGTWQILLANRYSVDLYKNKEVAYNLWNMTFGIGFSLLNAISTSLCVREKMYILLGCLIVGVGLCGFLEWTEKRKLNKKS